MITDTSPRIVSVEGDIITINFEPLENMTPKQKLQYLIAAGKYDWVNPGITANRFPVVGSGIKRFRAQLFDPRISSEDDVAAIKNENLTPANHAHGLAFGAAFPEEQRKYPIACLDSSAQVYGSRCLVYLHGDDAGRNLNLTRWDVDWFDHWRFLAVQEVSGA